MVRLSVLALFLFGFTVGCEVADGSADSVLARLGFASADPNNGADPNALSDPNNLADPNDFSGDPNDISGGIDPNQVPPGDRGEVRLRAPLTGPGRESGSAAYRLEGGRERFKVEIEDAAPASSHDIVINHVVIGTITANASGFAEIEFDTVIEPGHVPLPASFPTDVRAGDTVFIGNILMGELAED